MLVGRLQIHVGRIAQRGMSRANRLMGNAAVDPDVDRVVAMARALGQPERLRERDVVELEPNVGAALLDEIREFANPFRIENRIRPSAE